MRRVDSTTRDVADKTESSHTLQRRAVAVHKHWRWMPGMAIAVAFTTATCPWSPGGWVAQIKPTRVARVDDRGGPWAEWSRVDGAGHSLGPGCVSRPGGRHGDPAHDPLPDLDDPATLGCFEHGILREAWGPDVRVVIQLVASGGWRPCVYRQVSGVWTRVEVSTFFLDRCTTKTEALVAALEAAP